MILGHPHGKNGCWPPPESPDTLGGWVFRHQLRTTACTDGKTVGKLAWLRSFFCGLQRLNLLRIFKTTVHFSVITTQFCLKAWLCTHLQFSNKYIYIYIDITKHRNLIISPLK